MRVGQTLVGTVSVAVDRVAEEIARDALQDDAFRRAIRELVHRRSEELLKRLLENGRPPEHRTRRAKGRRPR